MPILVTQSCEMLNEANSVHFLFIWGFKSLSTLYRSRKGKGNQYIELVKVLYCKLPTNGKQLPAFPIEAMPGTEPQSQRWETTVHTV